MRTLTTRTAKSATGRLALTLLGVLALLGASAAVYAAAAKPDFKLAVSPSKQTVGRGQAASYKVSVKRVHGFKGSINLTVGRLPKGAKALWKLPDGRTLPRLRRSSTAVVLAKSKNAAILQIRTAVGTPTGNFRPTVKAASGRLKHNKTVTLTLALPQVGGTPAPSPIPTGTTSPAGSTGDTSSTTGSTAPPVAQPAVTVIASPASRNVLQGDQTTYSLDITRSGFTGPVALSASGLPTGATASFSPGSSVDGSTATLTVAAAPTTPVGTYDLTIRGTGGGVSGAAAATLVVQETKSFSIGGNLATTLAPGRSGPLDLALTNPYDFDLRITNLQVSIRDATSNTGCAAGDNYSVTQLSATYPLVIHPGATQLSSLVATAQLPQVEMLDLSTNQDICKGAQLTFDYTGAATK